MSNYANKIVITEMDGFRGIFNMAIKHIAIARLWRNIKNIEFNSPIPKNTITPTDTYFDFFTIT